MDAARDQRAGCAEDSVDLLLNRFGNIAAAVRGGKTAEVVAQARFDPFVSLPVAIQDLSIAFPWSVVKSVERL